MRFLHLFFISLFAAAMPASADSPKTETVILITIDGLRWQELYRGVDSTFFDQAEYLAHKKTHGDFKKAYGQESAEERRKALMPFFWDTIAKEGQLYGNRDKGSEGNLTNKFHFSYPGYSEILTGIADDARITSNDKFLNPNRTLPEWLGAMAENKGKVAAFGSWDVFPYILNEKRADIPVNAGFEAYKGPGKDIALLNKLQEKIPSPWDTVRLDAFTMGFARAALDEKKMHLVYIALGETDDFAHDGHYDQYIKATTRSDKAIAELWAWLQSDERYKNKTTLLITTDHGRGSQSLETWKHHGRFPYTKEDGTKIITDFPGDAEIWMAVMGPDTEAKGEVSGGEPVALTQVAATAAKFLGYSYESDHPELKAGKPIAAMMK